MNLEINSKTFIQMERKPHHNVNIVIFKNCGDIHPFSPAPSFPNARVVVFDLCDKNFTYYWLRPEHFPKARTYYVLSHPANYGLQYRFNDTHDIYVPVKYTIGYDNYWCDEPKGNTGNVIRVVDNFDYKQCLNIKTIANDVNATDPYIVGDMVINSGLVLLIMLLTMITRYI